MTATNIPPNLLGTVPDCVIAEQYGLSPRTVARYRHVRGIPGVSKGARVKAPRVAAGDLLLGTMPDAAIARIIGCAATVVRRRRAARGIPAFVPEVRIMPKAPPQARMTLPPEAVDLLGLISDAEVGRRTGIRTRTVQAIRTRMEIPAWAPTKREATKPKRELRAVKAPVVRAPKVAAVKPARAPKPPPAPKPAPAPRHVSARERLREQLREQEPAAGSRVRAEMVAPTPVSGLSLLSAQERTIIRDVRNGKPMDWIRRERRVTDEEIAALMMEAGL